MSSDLMILALTHSFQNNADQLYALFAISVIHYILFLMSREDTTHKIAVHVDDFFFFIPNSRIDNLTEL